MDDLLKKRFKIACVNCGYFRHSRGISSIVVNISRGTVIIIFSNVDTITLATTYWYINCDANILQSVFINWNCSNVKNTDTLLWKKNSWKIVSISLRRKNETIIHKPNLLRDILNDGAWFWIVEKISINLVLNPLAENK